MAYNQTTEALLKVGNDRDRSGAMDDLEERRNVVKILEESNLQNKKKN